MKAIVSKIESMGLVDGPGIRTVIFFSGCLLRCKYCHNPENWEKKGIEVSADELVEKVKRYKNYYGNEGGVTLSGGEPLLHADFLIELCKKLRKEGIHIALDTAGVGIGRYSEILSLVDLVILDIKATNEKDYKYITGKEIDAFERFIPFLNSCRKPVWVRQVIVPGFNDNEKAMDELAQYIRKINKVTKIELLPFHNMAKSKYEELGLEYEFKDYEALDKARCKELEKYLISKYEEGHN